MGSEMCIRDSVKSYTSERAKRKSTVELWNKIKTFEDSEWTRKYHDPNPSKKCFGGKVTIYMKDGTKIVEERGVADAHPSGQRPFRRSNYIDKFSMLTDSFISQKESKRFLSLVQNLKNLKPKDVCQLNVEIKSNFRSKKQAIKGIF